MSWSAVAARVAASTPAGRDRVVDLLRIGSILVVIAGHWLLAVVTRVDGRIAGDNLLALQPWTQWLTWLLQVMPVFFIVGGRVNGTGWDRARQAGGTAPAWIRRRADRLVRPILPLRLAWTVLTPGLAAVGVDGSLLRLGTQIVRPPCGSWRSTSASSRWCRRRGRCTGAGRSGRCSCS
jgi:hypothetical protein